MIDLLKKLADVISEQKAEILRLKQRERDLLDVIAEDQASVMRDWDIIDVKNAARLLQDYCDSFDICDHRCRYYYSGIGCFLKNLPCEWEIDK